MMQLFPHPHRNFKSFLNLSTMRPRLIAMIRHNSRPWQKTRSKISEPAVRKLRKNMICSGATSKYLKPLTWQTSSPGVDLVTCWVLSSLPLHDSCSSAVLYTPCKRKVSATLITTTTRRKLYLNPMMTVSISSQGLPIAFIVHMEDSRTMHLILKIKISLMILYFMSTQIILYSVWLGGSFQCRTFRSGFRCQSCDLTTMTRTCCCARS